MRIPVRIPVAHAGVYPVYGQSQMSLFLARNAYCNCEFERGHENKMFEMLAPGQPQDPARPGTWTTSTLDSQDPGRRWQIYLLMAI